MSFLSASIETYPLPKGEPVLVAVSGGADSMVLLHALRNRKKIVAAHFNHKLRGEASDADAQLVKLTTSKLGVQFVMGRWNSDENAIRQHGLEKAAREARLAFLALAARQYQCHWVVMGHHADDQVETFFWRLLRGAGGSGLGGMKTLAPFPGHPDLKIARPLLKLRKAEILAHAKAKGILFREDASNTDPVHLRNRIRQRLLPLLRDEFHAETDSAVRQSMELVSADSDCVKILAAEWLATETPQPFDALHPALQRQVIWHQLIARGVKPTHQLIEHLRLRPEQPRSINPTEALLCDSTGRLHLSKSFNAKHPTDAREWTLRPGWNESAFGGATLRCRAGTGERIEAGPGVEFFDADQVGPRVVLRHWQAGDRFEPIGLGRTAKLQDLFTNAKVTAPEKRQRVIACAASGEIFWVQGLRIGETAKIRPQTRRFLEWRWAPVEAV
jgi:tRNA(Ile)-lysidine synthase